MQCPEQLIHLRRRIVSVLYQRVIYIENNATVSLTVQFFVINVKNTFRIFPGLEISEHFASVSPRLSVNILADPVNLFTKTSLETVLKESSANGKGPGSGVFKLVKSLVAVDASRYTDRTFHF